MKIGTILKRKFNGQHEYTRLAVLHCIKTDSRVLYDIDNGVLVGNIHALYSEWTGQKLTKKEISELSAKINTTE